jgi:hypothetical protein
MPRIVENEKNPLVSKGIFRMAPATGLEPVTVRLTVREFDRIPLGTIGQNGLIPTV